MKVAIITSGGDAPGMNACIRSLVRSAIYLNWEIIGFHNGYDGVIDNDFEILTESSVANIIQRGGTILKTARCKRFYESKYRKLAHENFKKNNVSALIVIGGDGTFTGAHIFSKEYDIPVIGIPGTIDNDLYGTDYTIGYDTAINTVVEAVDKIRDTALSHNRIFVVEVMGKDAGFIALRSGIAVGAEAVLIPETKTDIEYVLRKIEKRRKSKSSAIILVAEGDEIGGGAEVMQAIKEKHPDYDVKLTILGHIQRGGSPSAMDRVLASQLGNGAIEALKDGKSSVMVGMINRELSFTSFEKSIKHHRNINADLLKLTEVLAI